MVLLCGSGECGGREEERGGDGGGVLVGRVRFRSIWTIPQSWPHCFRGCYSTRRLSRSNVAGLFSSIARLCRSAVPISKHTKTGTRPAGMEHARAQHMLSVIEHAIETLATGPERIQQRLADAYQYRYRRSHVLLGLDAIIFTTGSLLRRYRPDQPVFRANCASTLGPVSPADGRLRCHRGACPRVQQRLLGETAGTYP
jgi:hypothetical protein